MSFLGLISSLSSLFHSVAKFFADKQLIDLGRTSAKAEQNEKVLKNVSRAKNAINRARADNSLSAKLRKFYGIE